MDEETKQRAGGLARASNLSSERRTQIAREAAQLRWKNRREQDQQDAGSPSEADEAEPELLEPSPTMPVANWRGALNLVGVDVPCYVLDNGQKIIGRTSATEVLTGIKGGGALEKYIAVKALAGCGNLASQTGFETIQ